MLDQQHFSSSTLDEKSNKTVASNPNPAQHHIMIGVPSTPSIALAEKNTFEDKSGPQTSPHRFNRESSSQAIQMFHSGQSLQTCGSGENLHTIDNPQWISQVVNEALNKDLSLEQHLSSQEITTGVAKVHILWLRANQKTKKLTCAQLNQVFNCFPNLQILSLTDFDLHDLEFSRLKTTYLRTLRIRGCSGFGNAKLATIQQLPSRITSLSIANCPEINSKAFDTLKNIPLTKLVLRHINMTDETLAAVAKIETLQCLALSLCPQITTKGLEYLKESSLQKLRLYHYRIDDQVVAVLAKLALNQLSITKCAGLSFANVQRCQKACHTLKFSFSEFWDVPFFPNQQVIQPLSRQQIEQIFLRAISENMPIPQWLEERIGKDGAQMTELVVSANARQIDLGTIASLRRFLPNIEKLKFQTGHFIDCDIPKVLASFPKLVQLSFENCTIPPGFRLLETVARLQAITLINCVLDLNEFFRCQPRLHFVELNEQTLTEPFFQLIGGVEELYINQCKGLTKQKMILLAKSPTLKKLTLMRPTNTDDLLVPLQNMQSLRGLYIYLPTELTDQGMKTLAAIPCLTEVGINNCNEKAISENSLKQFLESQKDKNIESLELNFHSSMQPPLDSIFKLPKLHTLSLGYFNKLTDARLQEIHCDTSLCSLKLNNLSITGTGFSAFKEMKKLERVELEWCRDLTEDAYKNLAACKGLKYLKIQNSRFRNEWGNYFPQNSPLKLENLNEHSSFS